MCFLKRTGILVIGTEMNSDQCPALRGWLTVSVPSHRESVCGHLGPVTRFPRCQPLTTQPVGHKSGPAARRTSPWQPGPRMHVLSDVQGLWREIGEAWPRAAAPEQCPQWCTGQAAGLVRALVILEFDLSFIGVGSTSPPVLAVSFGQLLPVGTRAALPGPSPESLWGGREAGKLVESEGGRHVEGKWDLLLCVTGTSVTVPSFLMVLGHGHPRACEGLLYLALVSEGQDGARHFALFEAPSGSLVNQVDRLPHTEQSWFLTTASPERPGIAPLPPALGRHMP